MAVPTQNFAVIKAGLSLLIEQYKESPLFQAWLSSYLQQVQELEDATWEVIEQRYLDTAIGVQLDILGKIVQLEREGLTDELYRGALRVQIRINRSFGTEVDMLEVARLVLGQAYPKIHYQEFYPATIKLTFDQALSDDERFVLYRALFGTKAAGVRLLIVENFGAGNAFTFTDSGTLATVSALSFGSVHGAAGTGVLSHIHALISP